MLALSFIECASAIDAGVDGVSSAEAHEFAMGALEALQRASPRSLAITLRHFAAVAAALYAGARPWVVIPKCMLQCFAVPLQSCRQGICPCSHANSKDIIACRIPRKSGLKYKI